MQVRESIVTENNHLQRKKWASFTVSAGLPVHLTLLHVCPSLSLPESHPSGSEENHNAVEFTPQSLHALYWVYAERFLSAGQPGLLSSLA